MPRFAIRLEVLLEQPLVVHQETPRHREDLARTASVLIEHDGTADAEIALELAQHQRIGTGPGEDRLFVVSHREEVAVGRRQGLQETVLLGIEILKLVHQHVVPPGRDGGGDISPLLEQGCRLRHQIVEVQHVLVPQVRQVLPEQPLVTRRERVALEAAAAEQGLQRPHPVAPHAEPPQEHLLIGVVRDAEARLQPDRRAMLAEHRRAEPVDRASGDVLRSWPEGTPQPLGDLLGGLVREGHGTDAVRREAQPAHQVLDTADQAEGLPRPGTGDHQDWAQRRLDRTALRGGRNGGHAGNL